MSDKKIIEHLIDYIEKKEKQVQAEQFTTSKEAKTQVVKSIIDELEREISNED